MTPGDEQDMLRRLRIDVLKRHHIRILVHDLRRYLACYNLTEQAVLN